MKLNAKFGYCAYIIFGLIFALSGFAILSLEIAKIALFNQTNGELKVHIIDYVYLAQLICAFLYGCCCSCCQSENNIYINTCTSILSLTIYVLYMCFTIDEMGDIPFFCPEDYPYTSPLIRTACQVRAANLLLLWIIPGLSVIFILMVLVLAFLFCKTKENVESEEV